MVQSNDEYPFWARWYVDGVVASDITSVTYRIDKYDNVTNVFTQVTSGTISAADATGRWFIPFTIPVQTTFNKYQAILTPVGGNHPVLIDEVNTIEVEVTEGEAEPLVGCGTEIHTSRVVAPNGDPIPGVIVTAVPYGTQNLFASDTTDSNGAYTLSGLYVGHAYQISYNKDGYFSKNSEVVIA